MRVLLEALRQRLEDRRLKRKVQRDLRKIAHIDELPIDEDMKTAAKTKVLRSTGEGLRQYVDGT